MAGSSIDNAIALARACASRGDAGGILQACRQALAIDPREPRAWALLQDVEPAAQLSPTWLMLATMAGKSGLLQQAEACCAKVFAVDSADARAHLMMAAICTGRDEIEHALAHYRQCVTRDPAGSRIFHNMAILHGRSGNAAEAEAAYRAALECHADSPASRSNLVLLLRDQKRLDEALAESAAGLQLNPRSADLRLNHGLVLTDLRRWQPAAAALDAALEINPDWPPALDAQVHLYQSQRMFGLAADHLQRLISIEPDRVDHLVRLGDLLHEGGSGREAEAAYRKALEQVVATPEALFGLANVMQQRGDYGGAEQNYRAALALRPDYPDAHSNLLMLLNYSETSDGVRLLEEHRRWAAARDNDGTAPLPGRSRPDHDVLRVGYVSADFYEHAVMSFLQPVLEHHDRDRFEVHCFSDTSLPDAKTRELQALEVCWHQTRELADHDLVRLVREHEIDVLVDLAGHTLGNRLQCFMQGAAPVQVSWLGYPNTSGLDGMHFRVSDARADPPGQTERFHTERLYRIDPLFFCYRPLAPAPELSAPPCQQRGHVTFGSFNTLAKITPQTLALWLSVLERVPGSRLLLKCGAFGSAQVREQFHSRIEAAGFDQARVSLLAPVRGYAAHLSTYADIDIALDTFPYNGTTTTCEALWMGVPVVTRSGQLHAGRVGTTLLHALGLDELVADNDAAFVDAAVQLASDPARLRGLRQTLRDDAGTSALGDEVGFTRKLEGAYQEMWRQVAGSAPAGAGL